MGCVYISAVLYAGLMGVLVDLELSIFSIRFETSGLINYIIFYFGMLYGVFIFILLS